MGMRAILQACVDAKTVRRVVCTSSIGSVVFNPEVAASGGSGSVDENSWTDVKFLRKEGGFLGPYVTINGLDVVTVLPSVIVGPFITPRCPDSVCIGMALILGEEKHYPCLLKIFSVHVDDVVRAHIHLFEYPNAKGRYICSTVDFTVQELHCFLAERYPEYNMIPLE